MRKKFHLYQIILSFLLWSPWNIGMTKADGEIKPVAAVLGPTSVPNCPNPQFIGSSWQEAGRERIFSILGSLGFGKDILGFPDMQVQINSFVNSQGQRVCEYFYASPAPLLVINLPAPPPPPAKDRK